MTQLDEKLKELATTDWEQLMEIAGPDITFVIKARLLRKEGKTWQQISVVLKSTPMKVRTACKIKAVNF